MDLRGETSRQFIRFILTGIVNTLVTLIVIVVCKSVIGMNLWISNALGYVAGVTNSFIWSRIWVFKSKSQNIKKQALTFLIGFGLCYLFQFAVTWSLTELTSLGSMLWHTSLMTISGYGIATLIGMCCYTVAFFLYNRSISFRK